MFMCVLMLCVYVFDYIDMLLCVYVFVCCGACSVFVTVLIRVYVILCLCVYYVH